MLHFPGCIPDGGKVDAACGVTFFNVGVDLEFNVLIFCSPTIA